MGPAEILREGIKELDSTMVPHGFDFVLVREGRSSGGEFAYGEYHRGNRRLELHFRWSLGLVTYHVGDVFLAHEEYIRAVLGVLKIPGENAYPGFSRDPLDGFRHLREDPEHFGDVFLTGSGEEFQALKVWADAHPKRKGFRHRDDYDLPA